MYILKCISFSWAHFNIMAATLSKPLLSKGALSNRLPSLFMLRFVRRMHYTSHIMLVGEYSFVLLCVTSGPKSLKLIYSCLSGNYFVSEHSMALSTQNSFLWYSEEWNDSVTSLLYEASPLAWWSCYAGCVHHAVDAPWKETHLYWTHQLAQTCD